MHVTVVVPSNYTLARTTLTGLAVDTHVLHATEHLGDPVDLTLPAQDGLVLILTEPSLITNDQFLAILDRGKLVVEINQAIALVPGSESIGVLATAAACYMFSAHSVHLAGGLDSSLPIHELGLDTQLRLAGRAIESLRIGNPAVIGVPALEASQYLTVLSKNLTSQVQNAYLAPLLTGIIDHSIRDSDMDTSVLDLQRSPGNDDILDLGNPGSAFAGAQTVRHWGEALKNLKNSKFVTSEARRIPDRRLPYLHSFIDEVWRSTGVPDEQRQILEQAFEDIAPANVPEIVFVAHSDDLDSLERLKSLTSAVDEPVFWWAPDTHTIMEKKSPDTDWYPSPHDLKSLSENTCICYLIGTPIREAPWVSSTPTIVIADFTLTDIQSELAEEWVANTVGGQFKGSFSTILVETLVNVDHVISKSSEQRDFLLGALASTMRLNQYTYDEDHSLRTLISIEEGTNAALAAINRPVHPFERVQNTPEYEKAPYDKIARGSESFMRTIQGAPRRAVNKVKGVRS